MTALAWLVGALGEAWAELRHHKLRVALSLVGIAVAVGALTSVVALSDYMRQYQAEQSDRYGGRVATLQLSGGREDGAPVDNDRLDAQFERVSERYGFSRVSRVAAGVTLKVQGLDGVHATAARLIDPDYAVIHRLPLAAGRWFTAQDEQLLAPPVVVSAPLWESLGAVPLRQHPTLTLTGDLAGTYLIVGVTPKQGTWDTEHRVDMMYGTYRSRVDALPAEAAVQREIWVPVARVDAIAPALATDLRAVADPGVKIAVNRVDWAAQAGAADSAQMFELVTGAIAAVVLLLGGLSLVNVQLVAMRQRIREIGVRRSFGATAGRVFTSVMLESVVATAVAGAAGIVLAVVALRSPLVLQMFSGMQDLPPFPLRAAVTGLGAAVLIGALAGLVPALVALRVNVIDTLRF
ncbi:ABC transporter permease [Microbacterium sp. SORGH_AS_0888]|uniref:ABC transporter permease n=1 Tax=Microbacterium sp. SORGH_AS_0888 TaxID=3041791 RepID=UPI00277E4F32|nr:ABC transporter permease [Microbacterium sp. SORGH_AS_0888]MDQ1127928.1 putative ABC transport system permease protein [Microbacterium sp. SORGH_AS_0888]